MAEDHRKTVKFFEESTFRLCVEGTVLSGRFLA